MKIGASVTPFILAIAGPQPVDELVAKCAELLAMAETGELRALAYVSVRTGGSQVGTGWCHAPGEAHGLSTGLLVLNNRFAVAWGDSE